MERLRLQETLELQSSGLLKRFPLKRTTSPRLALGPQKEQQKLYREIEVRYNFILIPFEFRIIKRGVHVVSEKVRHRGLHRVSILNRRQSKKKYYTPKGPQAHDLKVVRGPVCPKPTHLSSSFNSSIPTPLWERFDVFFHRVRGTDADGTTKVK